MPEAVCGPRGLPDPDGSGRLTFFRFGALTDIGASDNASGGHLGLRPLRDEQAPISRPRHKHHTGGE